MGFMDRLREDAARRLEQKARIEEAKAGKSLRRTAPHIRKADRLNARAEKLKGPDTGHGKGCVCKTCCDQRLGRR
jgi:hypothetical protein